MMMMKTTTTLEHRKVTIDQRKKKRRIEKNCILLRPGHILFRQLESSFRALLYVSTVFISSRPVKPYITLYEWCFILAVCAYLWDFQVFLWFVT